MSINPVGNRVLILPRTAPTTTSTGLYMPTNQNEKATRGTIVAHGSEVTSVMVGDEVIFDKFASHIEIQHDGVAHLLLDADNVLAVVK